jgi:hypothetical protein
MSYRGDFRAGAVLPPFFFNTRDSTGAPASLGGSPTSLVVYKDGSTTQSGAGVTFTGNFDGVTGLNAVTIDTSADTAFYTVGSRYTVVLDNGVVSNVSVVGAIAAEFSLSNLAFGVAGLVVGSVASGATTTVIPTDLTEATNDHYNGRYITFVTGALAGQSSDITDYFGAGKELSVTALTEAPNQGDKFVIS